MKLVNKLNKCLDFSCILSLVKEAVESTIGRRRVGLSLALADLPTHIGAFHQLGSNFIVMNKTLLEKVVQSGNKKLINSYIFHILLHEYLHSLGYVDEEKTQFLSYAISRKILGADHLATLIARYGIGSVLSNLGQAYESSESPVIEIIEEFETDNLNYLG